MVVVLSAPVRVLCGLTSGNRQPCGPGTFELTAKPFSSCRPQGPWPHQALPEYRYAARQGIMGSEHENALCTPIVVLGSGVRTTPERGICETREGVVRRYLRRQDGTFRGSVVYSVLTDERPEVRARLVERPLGRNLARHAERRLCPLVAWSRRDAEQSRTREGLSARSGQRAFRWCGVPGRFSRGRRWGHGAGFGGAPGSAGAGVPDEPAGCRGPGGGRRRR
jgi:hypothetical protein